MFGWFLHHATQESKCNGRHTNDSITAKPSVLANDSTESSDVLVSPSLPGNDDVIAVDARIEAMNFNAEMVPKGEISPLPAFCSCLVARLAVGNNAMPLCDDDEEEEDDDGVDS